MKKVCIAIFLIITCFNYLFAPNISEYNKEQKNKEMTLISKLNKVLTENLKDYNEFVTYKEYNKPSLEKAIHKILLIKAVSVTEIGYDMIEYNSWTVDQKVEISFNIPEQAVGLLQIRPIMYRHLTQVLKLCNYGINDRWKADKSIKMFILFQDYYNPDWDIEHVSRDWNGGGGMGMKKSATIKYYNKVFANYNLFKEKFSI